MRTSQLEVDRRALAAVWTLSAAMLMLEVALTRALAVAQFHHFSFLVVSLALLGLGSAGSLLAAWPRLGARPELAAFGFGLAALAVLAVLRWLPFDSYAVAWDAGQLALLAATIAACAAPFVAAGLVVGALLAAEPARSHLVYAANLTGSAIGAVAALPLLARASAEAVVVTAAALGLVAAAVARPRRGARRWSLATGAAAAALLGVAWLAPAALAVEMSPYKGLSQAKLQPGARHTVTRWDPSGRIDVVESGAIHALPGLSLRASIELPPVQAGLTVDGDNLAPITDLAPDDPMAVRIASHVPEAVGGALVPGGRWLITETGGGWSTLVAAAGGASLVESIERSPAVADIVRNVYRDYTGGLFDGDRVLLVAEDPRARLRRGGAADVVLFPLRDGYHPVTSGAYALGEDYRLTVESVADALALLRPGGIVVATRWLQTPPTESLRLLATMEAALRRRGSAAPGDHLAAVRSMRTITVVAADEPLTEAQRSIVRRFADRSGFDLVWLPGLGPSEANRFQRLPEDVYYRGFRDLLADPTRFVREHAFDIRAVTDDHPYPNHYFRWGQTPDVLARIGTAWQPFGGSGYLVLLVLLGLAGALSVLLVLGPLVVRRHAASRPTPATLAYFSAIGAGYMLVLVPVSQMAILIVGHPAAGLALVSATLLVSGGLGSLILGRRRADVPLAAIAAGLVVAGPVLRELWGSSLGLPLPLRTAICCASLAPLGVLMGAPLPSALERIAATRRDTTAWSWAVNGCASVVAGILAPMAALAWGLGAVLVGAAGAYVVALMAWPRLPGGPSEAPGAAIPPSPAPATIAGRG